MRRLRLIWFLIGGMSLTLTASPGECIPAGSKLVLPIKAKLEGKPRQVRWGLVEKTMTRLREGLTETACELTFAQVFSPAREDVYFPLIGNLLRTVPEESLTGATVYSQSGRPLGSFANLVVFNKRGEYNYTNYYFQFTDSNGQLQSSGNRSLIDVETGRPFFLLRWDEIKDRTLMTVNP